LVKTGLLYIIFSNFQMYRKGVNKCLGAFKKHSNGQNIRTVLLLLWKLAHLFFFKRTYK